MDENIITALWASVQEQNGIAQQLARASKESNSKDGSSVVTVQGCMHTLAEQTLAKLGRDMPLGRSPEIAVRDTHARNCPKDADYRLQKIDLSFVPKDSASALIGTGVEAVDVVAFQELKMNLSTDGDSEDSAYGQILLRMKMVMEAQPTRTRVLCCVSDQFLVRFFSFDGVSEWRSTQALPFVVAAPAATEGFRTWVKLLATSLGGLGFPVRPTLPSSDVLTKLLHLELQEGRMSTQFIRFGGRGKATIFSVSFKGLSRDADTVSDPPGHVAGPADSDGDGSDGPLASSQRNTTHFVCKLFDSDHDRVFLRECEVYQLTAFGRVGEPSVWPFATFVNSDSLLRVVAVSDFGTHIFAYQAGFSLGLFDTIAKDICFALQFLHDKGFMHRDLSVGNILIAERDGRLVVLLNDFGSATQQAAEPVSVTVAFASPAVHRFSLFPAGTYVYTLRDDWQSFMLVLITVCCPSARLRPLQLHIDHIYKDSALSQLKSGEWIIGGALSKDMLFPTVAGLAERLTALASVILADEVEEVRILESVRGICTSDRPAAD